MEREAEASGGSLIAQEYPARILDPRREAVLLFSAHFNVRFWPIADICSCAAHVRFWGQSGHAPLVPMQWKVPHGSDIVRLGFELAICVSLAIAGGAHGGKMHSRASRHIPRIGILSPATEPGMRDWWKELTQGLNELGYVEGSNVELIWRFADGKFERLPALAAELAGLGVDIIMPATPPGCEIGGWQYSYCFSTRFRPRRNWSRSEPRTARW